jgi:hypothetical protein
MFGLMEHQVSADSRWRMHGPSHLHEEGSDSNGDCRSGDAVADQRANRPTAQRRDDVTADHRLGSGSRGVGLRRQ